MGRKSKGTFSDSTTKSSISVSDRQKICFFKHCMQSNPYKLRKFKEQGFPHGLPKSAIFMHKKRTLPPGLGFKVSTAINVGFLTYYSGRVGART